jgi:hypothetical protein
LDTIHRCTNEENANKLLDIADANFTRVPPLDRRQYVIPKEYASVDKKIMYKSVDDRAVMLNRKLRLLDSRKYHDSVAVALLEIPKDDFIYTGRGTYHYMDSNGRPHILQQLLSNLHTHSDTVADKLLSIPSTDFEDSKLKTLRFIAKNHIHFLSEHVRITLKQSLKRR